MSPPEGHRKDLRSFIVMVGVVSDVVTVVDGIYTSTEGDAVSNRLLFS